jgi:hypothetical protein
MIRDLDLMLLTEHLAVLRTGDRDAIEQRMLEMATALEGSQEDVQLRLSPTDRLVQSYLAFLDSANVNGLFPEVHTWMLEFMANHPNWIYSDNRSRDRDALGRLFVVSDDAAVRSMSVASVITGEQNILGDRNVDEVELVLIPGLWLNLQEVLEDRTLASIRLLELTETFVDLWIVPESHELARRCLQDLLAYARRAELIPIEEFRSFVAGRAEEIGGRLGEELRRVSQVE